jgi:hypothetical protein
MADELATEVLFGEGEMPADWREAIMAIARKERESMLRHRWLGELVGKRSNIGPNALRHIEQSLAALDPLKLESRQAVQVVAAVDHFMLGYVMLELLSPPDRKSLAEKAYIKDLVATGEYPRLAPLLNEAFPCGEAPFERGLKWLLDGIERDLA